MLTADLSGNIQTNSWTFLAALKTEHLLEGTGVYEFTPPTRGERYMTYAIIS